MTKTIATATMTRKAKGEGIMSKLPNTRLLTSLAALMLAAGLTVPAAQAGTNDQDLAQQTAGAQGALAYDQQDREREKNDADDLPTVTLSAPANNTVQLYLAPFGLTASVTFPGKADGHNNKRHGVAVEFLVNGQKFAEAERAPYQATFTPPTAGIYTLTAQIRFGEGKRTILSAPVTVISDVPPTAALTVPANGATVFTPIDVTLSANAASQIGTVAKVEFYAATTTNGTTTNTLVGTATSAPYSYLWASTPVGVYTLTAVATDNWGISSTSAPITLTVKPGELQIHYIHTDHLGATRSITDVQGNVVWQWANTEPFANNMPNENPANQGPFKFNLRFPGQYFDGETSLNYSLTRDYDPAIGRYIESDPNGLIGGVNTYEYANGNPIQSR